MYYWPPGVSLECTVQSFAEAYSRLGFEPCPSASLEPGYEKIALFAKRGEPQHAARQLPNGSWTSKCGQLEDIEHDLGALEGDAYGNVEAFLRRPTPSR
jgi:3'-phosphoadenosine 5'-phosphosulfate sulfotransferase (PAPS reductase)/FAD synthetase